MKQLDYQPLITSLKLVASEHHGELIDTFLEDNFHPHHLTQILQGWRKIAPSQSYQGLNLDSLLARLLVVWLDLPVIPTYACINDTRDQPPEVVTELIMHLKRGNERNDPKEYEEYEQKMDRIRSQTELNDWGENNENQTKV